MSVLILEIADEDKQHIKEVMQYASTHRRSMENPYNSDRNLVTFGGLINAYYSIDQYYDPTVWMRHLSISLKTRRPPTRTLMLAMVELFGFKNPEMGTMDVDPDFVVHALEPFEENNSEKQGEGA